MLKGEDFKRFKSKIALRKVITETSGSKSKVWRYYDFGPHNTIPLVLLHGASGTAEVFYRQMLSLTAKGYRLLSVQYPAYSTYERWLHGLDAFFDELGLEKIHLFGTALGGYLSQCYAYYRPQRVASLILCNTFASNQYYSDSNPMVNVFSWTPEFLLKRMLLANFPDGVVDPELANSIDFMVNQLEAVSGEDLSSRLRLNCLAGNYLPLTEKEKAANPSKPNHILSLDQSKITIIDVLDDLVIPAKLREEIFEIYPNARKALLKSGGDFPYLSRADEINLHIEVHLRAFDRNADQDQPDPPQTLTDDPSQPTPHSQSDTDPDDSE